MPSPPSRQVRRALGLLLGYGWTERVRPPSVALLAGGAVIFSALAAAALIRIWPEANAPDSEPPTNPAVHREGGRLRFEPDVPWNGGLRGRAGAVVMTPGLAAEEAKRAANWGSTKPGALAFGDDFVAVIGADGRATAFSPSGFEGRMRLGAAAGMLISALVAYPLLVMAARLLLRARFGTRASVSPLVVAGRALFAAGVYSGLAALLLSLRAPLSITYGTLFAVAAAGVLFGVAEGALGAPTPSSDKTT
jgi:hypothetical protein